MSPEFAPQAPTFIAEDMSGKKIDTIDANIESNPEGRLMVYKNIAEEVYANALKVADGIDDREETNIPYRRNAVYVASLLAAACIRGSQIS